MSRGLGDVYKRQILEQLIKLKKQLNTHIKKANPSLKEMVSQYLHFLYLKHLFVMVTQKDLMMKLIRVAILLMQIQLKLPVL